MAAGLSRHRQMEPGTDERTPGLPVDLVSWTRLTSGRASWQALPGSRVSAQ